ncbi:thiol peroxidase [Arachidicoccus sp.]|uniref:thiol peroxidase n=1 Tax=Arachidicoccus sp. TaxID=1872624 RepID=UPI003D2299E0
MKKAFIIITVLSLALLSCSQPDNSNAKQNNRPDSTTTQTNKTNNTMTTITLKGNNIHTVGKLPAVGTEAKNFTLVADDLSEKSLSDFKGKNIILNIFPSVNTGVCAASVREFNKEAAGLPNTAVLCISKDLPFAQAQFCGAEGIKNVTMLSDFRTDFGNEYGVQMADGPLKGLLSRAVIVINPEGKIIYEEQVPEITHEPDFAKALAAVK